MHRRESTPGMPHSYSAICFDLFGTLVDDEGAAIANAREALALLPATRVAIVTSASHRGALALLARARLAAPAVVISADDVDNGKPSPEPYLLASQRLGVEPVQALVVEDSISGVQAAHAAGMDAAFVLRGRSIGVCTAEYYLRGLDELASLIG